MIKDLKFEGIIDNRKKSYLKNSLTGALSFYDKDTVKDAEISDALGKLVFTVFLI